MSRRRAAALLGLFAAVATLGWLDYLTGPELAFSVFYLLPVSLAGWTLGMTGAVATAGAASLSWLWADVVYRDPHHLTLAFWNGFTRLVIYQALGVSVAWLRRDRDTLAHLNRRLEELLEREAALARTDPVTGLGNARAFREALRAEISRCLRSGDPLCLAYLDLDNFKRVNDSLGHDGGDALLQKVAESLRQALRAADVVARLGGDEFAILLWRVDEASAAVLAQRIVDSVARLAEAYPGCGLSASLGLARFPRAPENANEAVRLADAAMYEAKTGGKGRVAIRTGGDG